MQLKPSETSNILVVVSFCITSASHYGYYNLSPMYDVNGSIMTLEKFNKLAK